MPESQAVKMKKAGGVIHDKRSKTIKRRLQTRLPRRKVLKMLAVMEPQETSMEPANSHSQEFLSTGRTGRRNAMPDILGEHAVVSAGDLPNRLQGLSTSDSATGTSGTAPMHAGTCSGASTSKQTASADGS